MTLHPSVSLIFSSLDERNLGVIWLSHRSGVGIPTFYRWKRGFSPKLFDLIAVLQVLGYDLCALPAPEYKKAYMESRDVGHNHL